MWNYKVILAICLFPLSCLGQNVTRFAYNGNKCQLSASSLGVSVCSGSALPVKLVQFEALKEDASVKLSWVTTEEINADFFEVETSVDLSNWSEIGSVKAKNVAYERTTYSLNHLTPSNGINYYRLKMIDNDGTFAYSTIRNVSVDFPKGYLYPNPASDFILININTDEPESISFYNMAGQQVKVVFGDSRGRVSIIDLVSGKYSVVLKFSNGTVSTYEIVVAR